MQYTPCIFLSKQAANNCGIISGACCSGLRRVSCTVSHMTTHTMHKESVIYDGKLVTHAVSFLALASLALVTALISPWAGIPLLVLYVAIAGVEAVTKSSRITLTSDHLTYAGRRISRFKAFRVPLADIAFVQIVLPNTYRGVMEDSTVHMFYWLPPYRDARHARNVFFSALEARGILA